MSVKFIAITTVIGVSAISIWYALSRPKGRPSPCPPMGDVDGDGYVTEKDAYMVSGCSLLVDGGIVLTDEQVRRACVRGKPLSIVDAMLIQKYVKGGIDTFPVCSMS